VSTARFWSDSQAAPIRPRNVPGQIFFALSALTIGLYLALLLTSLLPETPVERHARLGWRPNCAAAAQRSTGPSPVPLFDRTARRLAAGPTLLLGADPGDEIQAALRSYDPALRAADGRFAFGNGVRLHGPVSLTPDLTAKAGLPAGMASAYFAGIAETGARWGPAGPRQVAGRGAAGAGPGRAAGRPPWHAGRPPMALNLASSVYSSEPVPADQASACCSRTRMSGCSQTRTVTCQAPISWSPSRSPGSSPCTGRPRLSRSALEPPPLALGELGDREPCRWELRSKFPAATAGRDIRLTVGEAALALARVVDGVAIDPYGFPVTRPEDLLPR